MKHVYESVEPFLVLFDDPSSLKTIIVLFPKNLSSTFYV
jgi:hypothetical protein